jgi:hypothetical protein
MGTNWDKIYDTGFHDSMRWMPLILCVLCISAYNIKVTCTLWINDRHYLSPLIILRPVNEVPESVRQTDDSVCDPPLRAPTGIAPSSSPSP